MIVGGKMTSYYVIDLTACAAAKNVILYYVCRILSSDLLQLLDRLQGDPQLVTVLPGSQLELLANMDVDRLSVVGDRAKARNRWVVLFQMFILLYT